MEMTEAKHGLETAYELGKEAQERGRLITDCPYISSFVLKEQWEAGWRYAENRITESQTDGATGPWSSPPQYEVRDDEVTIHTNNLQDSSLSKDKINFNIADGSMTFTRVQQESIEERTNKLVLLYDRFFISVPMFTPGTLLRGFFDESSLSVFIENVELVRKGQRWYNCRVMCENGLILKSHTAAWKRWSKESK